MTAFDDLTKDYRVNFLRYLPNADEVALHRAYELGRAAVASQVSILELAQVHHAIFLEVLHDTTTEDLTRVATAASDFFLEVIATYDMAQRSFHDRT